MNERAIVVGSGVMGAGIAEVLVRGGFRTTLCDQTIELAMAGGERVEKSLERAVSRQKLKGSERDEAMRRLGCSAGTGPLAEVSLVIEAVTEDLEVKKDLFRRLSAGNPQAMLASNTSSLSLTELAACSRNPQRVIGLHFFNPAPVMELLEIVRAEQTAPAVVDAAVKLAGLLGKTPIVVRDVAGFASSRLGIILGMEAIRMLESQVASAADIDRAMELGYRHPMGPLKLTDLVGLDVRLAIAEHLTREVGPQFSPPPLLRRMVRAGYLGKKSGRGFYRWQDNKPQEID